MSLRRHFKLTGSAITSRVAQWTQRAIIRSVQRGTITLVDNTFSNTATITAVDVANTFLTWGCASTSMDAASGWTNYNPGQIIVAVSLTNSTTVTASKLDNSAGTGTQSHTVTYEVVEFVPGIVKSRTAGTISISASATSATAALPSINPAKAFVITTGWATSELNTQTPSQVEAQVVITNSTTLTATRVAAGAQATEIHYTVLELY